MTQHIPRVRIITPTPDRLGATPTIFTRLVIDGEEWAAYDYVIAENHGGVQAVTVTFLADVTIEHPEPGL